MSKKYNEKQMKIICNYKVKNHDIKVVQNENIEEIYAVNSDREILLFKTEIL